MAQSGCWAEELHSDAGYLMLRLLIVDDHPLFCEALESAIRLENLDAEILVANSIDSALEVLTVNPRVDLALFDLFMPGTTGLSGLVRVRMAHPHLPLMVVSGCEDAQTVRDLLAMGIAGFVSKSTSRRELARSITEVLQGSIYLSEQFKGIDRPQKSELEHREMMERLRSLTPQQLRVLEMIRNGLQNRQIAFELHIAETTVKAHVSAVLHKLNVYSRTKATIEFGRLDFSQFAK